MQERGRVGVTYLRRAGSRVVSTGHEHHHFLLVDGGVVDLLLGLLLAILLLEFEAWAARWRCLHWSHYFAIGRIRDVVLTLTAEHCDVVLSDITGVAGFVERLVNLLNLESDLVGVCGLVLHLAGGGWGSESGVLGDHCGWRVEWLGSEFAG